MPVSRLMILLGYCNRLAGMQALTSKSAFAAAAKFAGVQSWREAEIWIDYQLGRLLASRSFA